MLDEEGKAESISKMEELFMPQRYIRCQKERRIWLLREQSEISVGLEVPKSS